MNDTAEDMNTLQTQDAAQARKAQYAANTAMGMAGQAVAGREYSMSELAEKRAAEHSEIASKSYQAAQFLRSHPEFEQFIKLVRSGAIQF